MTNIRQSAILKTFNVTELLEKILEYRDLVELIGVKRVCKRWKTIIEGSSALKNAFEEEPEHYKEPITVPASDYQPGHSTTPPTPRTVVANPVFFKIDSELFTMSEERFTLFRRPEASWWRMQMCNPPAMACPWGRNPHGVTLADVFWKDVRDWHEIRAGFRRRPYCGKAEYMAVETIREGIWKAYQAKDDYAKP